MRTRALYAATLLYLLTAFPPPAVAQVDQQRAQEFVRLEWRALARALRESGELRALAVREASPATVDVQGRTRLGDPRRSQARRLRGRSAVGRL
jgi:hypothetical protein